MNTTQLDQIIEAMLYEGYILYPYRPSSKKNRRERFTFGRVYPEAYSQSQNGAEPCVMQTECLVETHGGTHQAIVGVGIGFLQPLAREIGELDEPVSKWTGTEPRFHVVPELWAGDDLYQSWHEAAERRVDAAPMILEEEKGVSQRVPFHFPAARSLEFIYNGPKPVGVMLRRQDEIAGTIEIASRPLSPNLFKVTVRILNQTPTPDEAPRQELPNGSGAGTGHNPSAAIHLPDFCATETAAVLLRTFASTHTILTVRGGSFVSLLEPAAENKANAAACQNIGTWPVLVGDKAKGERHTMLSSPIILYDYPEVAAESAGPLFDGTEIDEILTLRIQSLTEAEKAEMRNADEHARKLLERTEALTSDSMLKLHGTMRPAREGIEFDDFFGASTPLKGVSVAGTFLAPGDRVRIRPKARADILDMALNGQTAVIEAVEQDAERHIHLALVLDNDPGKDLGFMRQPGHRFFFGADEVEPLQEKAA